MKVPDFRGRAAGCPLGLTGHCRLLWRGSFLSRKLGFLPASVTAGVIPVVCVVSWRRVAHCVPDAQCGLPFLLGPY